MSDEFVLGRAEIKPRQTAPEPPMPPLLVPVSTVIIPELPGRFSARDKFVLNYGRKVKPGVRIAFLSNNFQNWFGDAIEEPVAKTPLDCARLTRPELDGPILASLGNRPDLVVLLRQIYWLMSEQPNGESGTLLNNGRATIFYMPGLTRVVSVFWFASDGGWFVDAGSVSLPFGWSAGSQVFSRNCCILPSS